MVVVAVLVAVLLRAFVVQTFFIPSGSMEPTLQIGDRILVNKLSYHLHGVDRGDIVVFSRPPAENCGGPEVNDLVKRVIGLPGDVISLSGGYVYIDGKRLDESWLPASEQGITFPGPAGNSSNLAHPYRVPANDYFVMGDNRTDSCDSRYWGPISQVAHRRQGRRPRLADLVAAHLLNPLAGLPAGGLSLVLGLRRHPRHRRHALALVEVHDPDTGGVASLRGDLAGLGPDDHAARGDQQDLLVQRDHERARPPCPGCRSAGCRARPVRRGPGG